MVREKVTVCIPHVMRENLLRMCLESVRGNVNLPYRIIIMADGKKPLSFTDDRIQVVYTGLDRTGNAFKKKRFTELVETEYLFALDNDILVRPGSLEAQVQALDQNPHLAAISGITLEKGRLWKFPYLSGVCDLKIVGKFLLRRLYSLFHVFASEGDLFEADYIPLAHTTFRMKALGDVSFDPNYEMGYTHLDIFLQLYFTKWKCALQKKSRFDHVWHKSSVEYLKKRESPILREASRRYFIEKWGYRPIDFREKALPGRALWTMSVLSSYLMCPYTLKYRISGFP